MKLYFKKKQNKLPDENAACLPSDVRISNPTSYQPQTDGMPSPLWRPPEPWWAKALARYLCQA